MKFSEKNQLSQDGYHQIFGIDFHDFIQREQTNNMVELANEYGLHVRDIKNLKRGVQRS
ncbi:hypothetical protein [Bacillus testis]|uniref:hypothetical protein n=1 Tax=Bacillus testis TaxID=1622072 RepID=UPI00067F3D16|nr:hypothetical protein [Bacillus testis]